MSENTELAVREADLEIAGHMGDLTQVEQIKQRIVSMAQVPPDVPNYVIEQMAQLCHMLHLNPFTGDLYIIETGSEKVAGTQNTWVKKYAVHVGIKGLRKLARKQARFQTQMRVLDAEEVKNSRPALYDADDVGVECTLWRLDVATECRLAGIPYVPVKAVGYWRKKAQQRTENGAKVWKPDNIPNTWTSEMVAEKRAEVNAIKKAFDIDYDVDDPAHGVIDGEGMIVIQRQLEALERSEAPVTRQQPVYEADGDILFDNPVTVYASPELDLPKEVVQTIDAEEEDFGLLGPTQKPFVGVDSVGNFLALTPPYSEDAVAGYTEIDKSEPVSPSVSTPARVTGDCPVCHAPAGKPHATKCPNGEAQAAAQAAEPTPESALADGSEEMDPYIFLFHDPDIKFPAETGKVIRQIRDLDKGDTMTPKQHGYIVALLDKAYGSDEFKPHRMILSALAGRLIDHDHRLAYATKVMLDWYKFPDINKEEMAGMDWLAALVIDRYRDVEDI